MWSNDEERRSDEQTNLLSYFGNHGVQITSLRHSECWILIIDKIASAVVVETNRLLSPTIVFRWM